MAHLNPTPRPEQAALAEYVPPPGRSTADDLAVRFELDPTSSLLVVGWIGTGKTTQLLAACEKLSRIPGVIPWYVDVSTQHDLADIKPGVLLAIAGLRCADAAVIGKPEVASASRSFRGWALGWSKWVPWDDHDHDHDDYDGEPGVYVPRPAVLKPPAPSGIPDVMERVADLRVLLAAQPGGSKPVCFFDSLDRLGSIGLFRASVKEDLQALKEVGIGVAIVGPPRVLYATDRGDIDLFDKFLEVPIIDVKGDAEGKGFLLAVLRKRAPGKVLSDDSAQKIIELSGGVIRDLIAIAAAAGEEAYLAGADEISPGHVITAADRFGQGLLLGVRPNELQALRNLRSGGKFVASTEDDLSLLQSRRILLYRSGRHVIHPSLARLI
jgi:hypothetical protein